MGNSGYQGRHSVQMFTEGRSFSGNERFQFWCGRGDGSYVNMSYLAGADSNLDGRALLTTDFDDDGDLDLFVHSIQRDRHRLYRNETEHGGSFLKLRVSATTGNYEGIGAIVTVAGPRGSVAQVLSRGAGFESCQAPELIFGLGAQKQAAVSVLWPGGARESFGELPAGGRFLLTEGSGKALPFERAKVRLPDPTRPGLLVRVGARLDAIPMVTSDGEETLVDVRALADGKPVLLNFWASHCRPCLGEMRDLAAIAASGDYRVLLLSVDEPDNRAHAHRVLSRITSDLPVWYPREGGAGLDKIVDLENLPIPMSLYLSPEGVIERIHQGAIDK